jgi:hypothetical protein
MFGLSICVSKRCLANRDSQVGYPVINHPFYDALKASNNHNLEEITEKWVDKIVSDVKEQGVVRPFCLVVLSFELIFAKLSLCIAFF